MWNRLRYTLWAPVYDAIARAAGFESARRLSIERLELAPGDRVAFLAPLCWVLASSTPYAGYVLVGATALALVHALWLGHLVQLPFFSPSHKRVGST